MIVMTVAIVVLAAINIVFKAAGPALLGDRKFGPRTQSVVDALPAALLAGLLTVDVLGQKWQAFDWTVLPGLVIIIVLRRIGRSHLASIAVGVIVTAALRAIV